MATHSSILAWRIPWTEEPGGLEFVGSQRVTKQQQQLSKLGFSGPQLKYLKWEYFFLQLYLTIY